MTAFFISQDYSAQMVSQPNSEIPLVILSSNTAYPANTVDVGVNDQFSGQFYNPDPVQHQQAGPIHYLQGTTLPFFPDSYPQTFGTPIMTKFSSTPQLVLPASQFFQFTSTAAKGQFDQCQEPQQESLICRLKRQKDENYKYSFGCISRRVKSWLEKSQPYALEAQTYLEDQLVSDSNLLDGGDETVFDLFDENRKERFLSQLATISTLHSEQQAACCGIMSNPFLYSTQMVPEAVSAASPRCFLGNISVSDDLHGSCQTEQEFISKFPKQIPPVCSISGVKVQFEELTDRSVLRNWRCCTDDGDLIYKKGRKRFFRRVAVLPPDSWLPNKRPQPWEWAPSGPFALNVGEFVSISGTNGYPYEIVLIRHIPPALRCFISLVPVSRELAAQMLNGERIAPQSSFIPHIPVDSVTHKWILNGVRPRDFTREVALDFINKDIELERAQKERRKAKKENVATITSPPSTVLSSFLSVDSLVTPSSEDDGLAKSVVSNDSLCIVNGPTALVI